LKGLPPPFQVSVAAWAVLEMTPAIVHAATDIVNSAEVLRSTLRLRARCLVRFAAPAFELRDLRCGMN
jgi:hypothetical protein